MNIVGKELERHGFEFLAVNSKPKKNPQFVCLKEKKTHFIVVRAVPYPEDPLAPDQTTRGQKKKILQSQICYRAYLCGQ